MYVINFYRLNNYIIHVIIIVNCYRVDKNNVVFIFLSDYSNCRHCLQYLLVQIFYIPI